ncbi:putative kinesin heavy chain isoform [Hordeum vulgare]|nr:putative kinesin heavy chain isoform [Hordeum vulgare]
MNGTSFMCKITRNCGEWSDLFVCFAAFTSKLLIISKLVDEASRLDFVSILPALVSPGMRDHQEFVENKIGVDNNMVDMNEQLVAKDAEITKLKDVVNELKFLHVAQGNVIRNLKFNHLKEKETMSSNNMTLKFCWADLKKEKEKLDGCIAELMNDKEKLSIEKSTME